MKRKNDTSANPAALLPVDETRWNAALAFIAIVSLEVILGTAVLRMTRQNPVPAQAPAMPAPSAAISDAHGLAQWVASSGDAGHRPFVIVDKLNARVMAFEASGQLRSSSPALLGLARGDDSVPGIGTRKMADIAPEERITPAGRFMARRGTNLEGEDIVWIDYDAAVSMHRVRATVASEQRLQRLATPAIDDNRISYGCINLPAAFYDAVISPMAKAGPVVIYVLPETRPLVELFAHREMKSDPLATNENRARRPGED